MRYRTPAVPAVLVIGAALLALLITGCGSSAGSNSPARRPVTAGFTVGSMADGPLFAGGVNISRQLGSMVASGVESLRVSVDWSTAQPTQAGPIDFSQLDRIVGPAAAHDLSVLPVVEYAPRWDALQPGNRASATRSPVPYAAFMAALARRYGPHGTYWSAHPQYPPKPIRMWQIWNEPNFSSYWSEQPFAPSYVRLVGAARSALRAVDPGAEVVLAGLPNFSWQYLAQIYRVPGARSLFDLVAVHPYTAQARGVITILSRVRAVMNRFGDRAKPMLATEVSWPSSDGRASDQFGIGTNEAGQASRLREVMPLLAQDRAKLGLAGFYWYTWMGDEGPTATYAFDYAGLLRYVSGQISAKPALAVFQRGALAIEGCARKAGSAGTCAQ